MAAIADLKRQELEEAVRQRHAQQQEYLARLVEQEAQLGVCNRGKVAELVRTRQLQAKTADARKELQELQSAYERNMERKDAAVALLARYTTLAEEQRRRQVQSHSQVVSDLLGLLTDRMGVVSQDAEDQIARLQAQYSQELESLKKVYQTRIELGREVLQATKNEEGDLVEELQRDYSNKLQEIQGMNKEQFNITQMHLQEQNTLLENTLLEEYEKYRQATESKQHQFKILLIKDQQSSNAIEDNKRKIESLQRQIAHWKAKISQTTEEFREKNFLLRQEKDENLKEYQKLKKATDNFRSEELQRRKDLAKYAHDAQDKIVQLKERAERIIRTAVLCGRMETEAERVGEAERLDPQTRREIDQEVDKLKAQEEQWMSTQEKTQAEETVKNAAAELKPVYRKLAGATIDRLALQREQALLERENSELREALQRFLSVGTVGGI